MGIKNIEAQEKVLFELDMAGMGQSRKNIQQLQTILQELRAMDKAKGIVLSYPRFIIDAWEHSDSLGMALIELAELYKKI
jgi:hypothetical protein